MGGRVYPKALLAWNFWRISAKLSKIPTLKKQSKYSKQLLQRNLKTEALNITDGIREQWRLSGSNWDY